MDVCSYSPTPDVSSCAQTFRDACAGMKRCSSDHSLTASSLRSHHYETRDIQGSPDTPFHFSYINKSATFGGSVKGFAEDVSQLSSCHSSDSDLDVVCTYSQELSEANELVEPVRKSWSLKRFFVAPSIAEGGGKSEPTRVVDVASELTVPFASGAASTHPAASGTDAMLDIQATSTCSSPQANSMGSFGLESDDQHDDSEMTSFRSSNHLTRGHAAYELFLRVNHARQTLDFAKRQASTYAELDKAEMGIWQALSMLNELREYEAPLINPDDDPSVGLSLRNHAFQTAELCRLHHPQHDWLHLVGLIHSLGKLLAHPRFGAQPQWAVCGETFPLGCRFDPQVTSSQFFSVNPDRRRRVLNTPCGIYEPGCGLQNVYMSWGGPDYLYLVLLLNQTALPAEALFIIRNQKFAALTRSTAYHHLLSPEDRATLPLLASFQELSMYEHIAMPEGALQGDALVSYYSALITKYIGEDNLFW